MLHCYFCNGIHKWQLMEDQKIMLVYRTFILDRASCFWKPIFMSSLITGTQWNSRKHGRGARGATPASNAARRGHGKGTPLLVHPAASCHVFFFFSHSGGNSKKEKKRCKTHRLSLITYHTSAVQLTSCKHQALWLSLTPSLVSHSLCALAPLPLSLLFVSPVAVRHSARQPLNHSKHQSSALFQSCGLYLIYEHHVLVII